MKDFLIKWFYCSIEILLTCLTLMLIISIAALPFIFLIIAVYKESILFTIVAIVSLIFNAGLCYALDD